MRILSRSIGGFACVSALCALTGCATLKSDYYFEPSVADVANGVPIAAKEKPKLEPGDIVVSDRYILSFLNQVRHALRHRMTISRIARVVSSTTQLVTATAAAALGAGAGSGVAIAALASTSATIPEFAGIFQTGARAEAYHRGLSLIEAAEARYFASLAVASAPGVVSETKLTKEGAALYSEVVASVNLVEKAILGLIPSLEEVELAEGRLFDNILSINESSRIKAPVGESKTVTTQGAGPLVGAFSSDPKIVVAGHADRTVFIEARAEGIATITLINDHGARAFLEVEVTKPAAAVAAAAPAAEVQPKSEAAHTPSCDGPECSFWTEAKRKELQRRLCVEADGIFGPQTRDAIKEYQASSGAASPSGVLTDDEAKALAEQRECTRPPFVTYYEVVLSRDKGIGKLKETLNTVAQSGLFTLAQPLVVSGASSEVIDDKTREAVKAFQSAKGLTATGAITIQTYSLLGSPRTGNLEPDQ